MTLRRMACIDVPDLPLQMLLREHPTYRDVPTAVVAEERPEAELLLINRHARALRLPNPGGRAIEIVAELPSHMQKTFDVLGFDTSTVEDFFDLRKPKRKR